MLVLVLISLSSMNMVTCNYCWLFGGQSDEHGTLGRSLNSQKCSCTYSHDKILSYNCDKIQVQNKMLYGVFLPYPVFLNSYQLLYAEYQQP